MGTSMLGCVYSQGGADYSFGDITWHLDQPVCFPGSGPTGPLDIQYELTLGGLTLTAWQRAVGTWYWGQCHIPGWGFFVLFLLVLVVGFAIAASISVLTYRCLRSAGLCCCGRRNRNEESASVQRRLLHPTHAWASDPYYEERR